MSTTNQPSGMLGPNNLRAVDDWLLTYLVEGRVTPAYARRQLIEDDVEEYSRGYVQQRLGRLEEHDHVVNLYGVGLYELQSDPREDDDTEDQ